MAGRRLDCAGLDVFLSRGKAFNALLLIHGSHFIGRQESTTRATGSSHGMVVSRFMQVRLAAFGSESQLFLEFLPRNTSLQDAVELFRIYIER